MAHLFERLRQEGNVPAVRPMAQQRTLHQLRHLPDMVRHMGSLKVFRTDQTERAHSFAKSIFQASANHSGNVDSLGRQMMRASAMRQFRPIEALEPVDLSGDLGRAYPSPAMLVAPGATMSFRTFVVALAEQQKVVKRGAVRWDASKIYSTVQRFEGQYWPQSAMDQLLVVRGTGVKCSAGWAKRKPSSSWRDLCRWLTMCLLICWRLLLDQ